jgi:hypothetical protein
MEMSLKNTKWAALAKEWPPHSSPPKKYTKKLFIHDIKKTGEIQIAININDEFVDAQKAKLLKQKKEEGNTAFKNSQLEEAYKLYR